MASYDPEVLEKFADRLYLRARSIVAIYTVLGLILGGIAGALIEGVVHSRNSLGISWTFALALLGLALGAAMGMERAFWIKVEAQRTLCLVQIEVNSRPSNRFDAPEKQLDK